MNDGDPIAPGVRVRIRRDPDHGPGPWPAEPTGHIAVHPMSATGEGWVPTQTLQGERRTYWIVFDEPQVASDGDGPYPMSEVLDVYVEREARDDVD